MKKTFSFFLALILILGVLPLSASAVAAPALRIECEYNPAESCIAEIAVWLDNCSGMAAGAFSLSWTGDDLRFIKGEPGNNGGSAAVDAVGNTVGYSVAFPGVCQQDSVRLFTVYFGVKRACTTEFSLSVSDRQIYGVKIPKAVSLSAEFPRPEGGMPYYITSPT
ncbi:MAG: hypothetical protein IJL26_04030, partial [Clostridia bacterium]|nr:hypothetical protein [Clostridia bacterium]